MRRSLGGIGIVVLAAMGILTIVGSHAPAIYAQMGDNYDEATIQSLLASVQHAADAGLIDDHGVIGSLLAKLDAAQAALDRGQLSAGVHLIQSFMREVSAQTDHHIDATQAQRMREHAQRVILALEES